MARDYRAQQQAKMNGHTEIPSSVVDNVESGAVARAGQLKLVHA